MLLTDEARLGRGGACAARELSAGGLLEILATLALRVGPRRADWEGRPATDCRLVGAAGLVGAALGLAAMTLEGLALGVVAGAFGFGAADFGVEGGGGAGCDNIAVILESRMNKPWPGGHVK